MEDTRSSPRPARISVTDPVSHALGRTSRVLFKPFDLGKWFVLGFCAWLAWIGQGGGNSFSWNVPRDEAELGAGAVRDWIDANLALFVVLAVIVVVLVVGLVVLLTWLSSRGKLMFLDGVVHNRGAVVEPWHRFKVQGNSLFGFRVVVGLIALLVFGALATLMILNLVAMDIENSDIGFGAMVVLCLWITVLLGIGIVFGLVSVALNDIVVPIMWLRGCRVMDAWSEFRPLLGAHARTFVLYVLMKILLGIVIVFIGCLATCVTCCIAALPYVGTVILLPLFVFRRSYSIYFLSQFGPEYASLGPVDAPPVPQAPTQDAPLPPEVPKS